MITEIAIIFPLFLCWYFGILNMWIVLSIILTIYWIPKYLIHVAETMFLNVLFRHRFTVANNCRNVSLTFDDVPYDTKTYKEILQILDSFNVKATFFVISGQITTEAKNVLINAVKNGHHLGNHGHTNTMHALLNNNDLFNEIQLCHTMINEIYQRANVELPNTIYYRPGCGIFTTNMIKTMSLCDSRYKLALGSVYPNDPIVRSSIINYYYLINHIQSGDIIILHDRKWTVPLLPKLLNWLTTNQYNVVPLDN